MSNSRAVRRQMRRSRFVATPRDVAGGPMPPARPLDDSMPRVVMIAYGATCLWWDDKTRAGKKPSGLPCCPHCGGVLFEAEMQQWWADAHRYQDDGHPDYVPFLRWLQGQCFPTRDAAEAAYAAHKQGVQA